MTKDLQLIQLYCAVCRHYDNTLVLKAGRLSNNFCPKFTDAECIATYIWGIHNQKFTVRGCYDFIKDFYIDWFPELPSYQAYNKRICYLADAIKILAGCFLCMLGFGITHADYVLDSLPIVVASSRRSGRAASASGLCDKGYCASKQMWYYGVKLHILAQCNYKAMPTPAGMMTSKASEHDLCIGREILGDTRNIRVFCDTAYCNKEWQEQIFAERGVEIITRLNARKGRNGWNQQTSSSLVPFQA